MNQIIESIIDTLKKPVPLPAFLLTPIELSALTGKKTSSKGKGSKKSVKRKAIVKPQNLQFALEGPLTKGESSPFSINGYDLKTTADTWIFGELRIGAIAKVKGVIMNGHERLCTSIVIKPDNSRLMKW